MSLNYGYLLLTCRLGDPERHPLTMARFRELTNRMRSARFQDVDRELTLEDLTGIGCSTLEGEQILGLLEQEDRVLQYLDRAEQAHCGCLTWRSGKYPEEILRALKAEAPATLWYKGDISVLDRPRVALVGSRELMERNRSFAQAVGTAAAKYGCALVSGNARGADCAAQEACLAAGGQVISVVADRLCTHRRRENVLWLSEDGFDEKFSAHRALSRNRVIHSLGNITFVAQTGLRGGTWDGTFRNLRYGWSKVVCFDDGMPGSRALQDLGAELVGEAEISRYFL